MKFILWFFLFVPKQDCIDRIEHDNIGKCEEQLVSIRIANPWSGYSYEKRMVCDKVKDPKPLPVKHYKQVLEGTEDPPVSDDCYDVYRSSLPLNGEKTETYGNTWQFVDITTGSFSIVGNVIHVSSFTPNPSSTKAVKTKRHR